MPNFSGKQWWIDEGQGKEVHTLITKAMKYWDEHQDYISRANLMHMRLYGNAEFLGLGSRQYAKVTQRSRKQAVSFNIVKSAADTVNALIAKNKPRPLFLTKGGDYGMQERAKRLSKLVEGVFYEEKAYETGPRCFLDCTIMGKGFAKVVPDFERKRVIIERVFPDEIVVDLEEARYGNPRQLHQRKYLSRERVLAKFGDEFKEEVMAAPRAGDEFRGNDGFELTDLIEVVESWHLPSGDPDAKNHDGAHAVTIHNATLLFEKYSKPHFPFATIAWGPAVLGYWPIGLAEEIAPIQRECNSLLRRIQEAMKRLSNPRVWVPKGSQVPREHLTNLIGGIVEYVGDRPPFVEAASVVAPEVFNHLDRLYSRAYELAGVSQLSAGSRKPSGLNSGAALREYNDIESERFALKAQAYEEFFMEIARLVVDAAEDLSSEGIDLTVRAKERRQANKIRWSEVKLDRDAYVLQVFPTNFLPSTPAGKLQTVKEMIQDGLLSPEHAMHLLDFPDLESVTRLVTAPIDDIKRQIEVMLDAGEYEPPEPFQNLEVGREMVLSAYLRAKLNGAPEEKLELLRNWLVDAQSLIEKSQPPAPGPGMPQGMPGMPGQAPGGPPMAPPPPGPQMPPG